jgi:hypothetical protein
MNTEHPGILALKNFINAFNTLEKDKIINNLHFPHFTHSDGNQPIKYENGELFWNNLKIQLDEMVDKENWSFSTLDSCEVINETENTLQCLVEFNRRYKIRRVMGRLKVYG